MDCYDCNIKVEPKSYPEGKCPSCGLKYTLPKEEWDWQTCENCGNEHTGEICLECV